MKSPLYPVYIESWGGFPFTDICFPNMLAFAALVPSESASSGAPKLKDVLRARGSKNEAKTAPVVSAAISQSISSVNQPRWQAPQHQGQNVHPASATASKPVGIFSLFAFL